MAMAIKDIAATDDVCECSIILPANSVKDLMNEYPGFFLKYVMGALDCTPLEVLYSSAASRPCYPVNIIIGILLLSIYTGFSHEMILKEISTNLRLRIALGVHMDPEFSPPDERTVDRFLERVCEHYKKTGVDLLMLVLSPVLNGLCEGLDQEGVIACRMDSTLIDNYLTREYRNQLIYFQTEVLVLKLVGATKAEVDRYTKSIHPSIENIIPLHEGEDPVPFQAPERPAFFDKAESIGLPSILHCFFDADDYNKRFYSDKDQDSKKSKQDDILKMAKELMDFCQEKGYTHLPEYDKLMNVLYFQCDLVKVIHPGEDQDSVKPELRLKPKNSDVKEVEAVVKQRTKQREGYEKAMAEYTKAAEKVKTLKDKLDQEVGNSKVKRLQEQYDKAVKKATNLAQIVEGLNHEIEELDKQEAAEVKVIYDEVWMENSHNMGSSGPQSHVDHSATYTRKYNKDHIGDKLTVMEAVDSKGRSRIIGFAYGANNVGDSSYGAQVIIEADKIFPLKGRYIVADAAFCGKGIEDAIKAVGAILVNTNLIGTVKDCCADHEFSSDGKTLTKCAGGQVPLECTVKEEIVIAKMGKAACDSCPHFAECKPRASRGNYILETSVNQKERALQKREMGSETHNVLTRFRNGSEATMNLAQIVFPIPDRPIYGSERKHMYATMSITVMAFRKTLAQSKIKSPYHPQNHFLERTDDCETEQNGGESPEVEEVNNSGSTGRMDTSTSSGEPVEKEAEADPTGNGYDEEYESEPSPESENEGMTHSFDSENVEPSQVDTAQNAPASACEAGGTETETDTGNDNDEDCESELYPENGNEGMTHSFESENGEHSQVEPTQDTEKDSAYSNKPHESHPLENDGSQPIEAIYSLDVETEYSQPLGEMKSCSFKSFFFNPTAPILLGECGYPPLIPLKTRLDMEQGQMILNFTELGLDPQQAQAIIGLMKQQLHVLWNQMDLNPLDGIPLNQVIYRPWRPTDFISLEMKISGTSDTTLPIPCNPTVFITYKPITQLIETDKHQFIKSKIFPPPKIYQYQIQITDSLKVRGIIFSHIIEHDSS